MPSPSRTITIKQAAEELGVSVQWLNTVCRVHGFGEKLFDARTAPRLLNRTEVRQIAKKMESVG